MEERIIEKDDEKIIRIKRTKEGEQDAVDGLSEEEETLPEEEIVLSVPEEDEEYDEDLVGLTPSQLKAELERRKKAEEAAHEEYEKLLAGAEEALNEGDYARAEMLYDQAVCYAFADGEVESKLWTARTKNFTSDEPFYVYEKAEELSESSDEAKAFVRERAGERLKQARKEAQEEADKIAPEVEKKQQERREAFLLNRRYYTLPTLLFAGMVALFLVGAGVAAAFITKTMGALPVILTGVFGGLALVALAVTLVFFRKWLVANRLCRDNERLSSTAEGARLEELQEKIECLDLILNG